MCQIYSMGTLLNTTRPQTVWDSHMSTTLRGAHSHSSNYACCSNLVLPPDMPIAELEVRIMKLKETYWNYVRGK